MSIPPTGPCKIFAEISAKILPRSCRGLRRHYHLAEMAEISPRMPRSRRDLAEIVQRFKKTLSSRRDCRDLTETAEIASRLPRSRRDRAEIYGDSNISPRMPRSCPISPRSCRDLRRHYHLAEISPRSC